MDGLNVAAARLAEMKRKMDAAWGNMMREMHAVMNEREAAGQPIEWVDAFSQLRPKFESDYPWLAFGELITEKTTDGGVYHRLSIVPEDH